MSAIERRALRRLCVAAAVSAAAHAAAVSLPVIEPAAPTNVPPLAVKIEHVPPPSTAPKIRAQPKPQPKRANARAEPRRIVSRPAAEPSAAPAVAVTAPMAIHPEPETGGIADAEETAAPESLHSEPVVVATAPASTSALETPALPAFPRNGRITYTLFYGRDRFPVGRTVQTWKIDGARYQFASHSETTGIVDLFRSQHRTYLSRGALTPHGFRPETFLMSRDRGRGIEEARARFDWKRGSVTLGPATRQREEPLPGGSQDLVSFMLQLALDPPPPGRTVVSVTNGSRLERYVLDVLPEERLETPLGVLRTLPVRQVRKAGDESVDVWLASEYRYLPVRIRFYDRDGEPSGEQIVNEIRLSEE